jgi:hypothetical protein
VDIGKEQHLLQIPSQDVSNRIIFPNLIFDLALQLANRPDRLMQGENVPDCPILLKEKLHPRTRKSSGEAVPSEVGRFHNRQLDMFLVEISALPIPMHLIHSIRNFLRIRRWMILPVHCMYDSSQIHPILKHRL